MEKVVEKNDYFTSVDLKDGFYHIPVNQKYQAYLSFQFEGKFYSYVVLPFGFCLSPYFFAKVLRPVVKYLRSQGVRLSLYTARQKLGITYLDTCSSKSGNGEGLRFGYV